MGCYLFGDLVDVYIWEDDGRVVATTITLSDASQLIYVKERSLTARESLSSESWMRSA